MAYSFAKKPIRNSMAKLKSLHLMNFGGYEDVKFDFSQDNIAKPLCLFYGPNGIGKSTILDAIKFVTNPMVFEGRDARMGADSILRSYVYDEQYIPYADLIMTKKKRHMEVTAVFETADGDKRVVMSNNGFVINELPKVHNGHCFFVDADNQMNLSKFQLHDELADSFLVLAEEIFGFPCDLDSDVTDFCNGEEHTFWQDLIVTKGNTKVHYSKMSAGEKKIATMLRQLCNPDMITDKDIVLIDNLEMHVYYKRHARMLDRLLEYLQGRQLISTTHSGVMVDHANPSFRYDLEDYRPEYKCLTEKSPLKSLNKLQSTST